jgi:hypothetical protein
MQPYSASSRQLPMSLPSPHYVLVVLPHAAHLETSVVLDRGPTATLDRQRALAATLSCSIQLGSLIITA